MKWRFLLCADNKPTWTNESELVCESRTNVTHEEIKDSDAQLPQLVRAKGFDKKELKKTKQATLTEQLILPSFFLI